MQLKARHARQKLQDPVKKEHKNHIGRKHLLGNLPPGSTFDLVDIQSIGVADHTELIMPTSYGQEPKYLLSQHPALQTPNPPPDSSGSLLPHNSNSKNHHHRFAPTSDKSGVIGYTERSGKSQPQQSSTTNIPDHQPLSHHGPPTHPPPSRPPPMIPITHEHPVSSRRSSSDFLL